MQEPKIKREVIKEPDRPQITYKIHKRSLPPGIDKIVALGLTFDEATNLAKTQFKTKLTKDDTWIYYDILLDGDNNDVYHNPGPIIKEDYNEATL